MHQLEVQHDNFCTKIAPDLAFDILHRSKNISYTQKPSRGAYAVCVTFICTCFLI